MRCTNEGGGATGKGSFSWWYLGLPALAYSRSSAAQFLAILPRLFLAVRNILKQNLAPYIFQNPRKRLKYFFITTELPYNKGQDRYEFGTLLSLKHEAAGLPRRSGSVPDFARANIMREKLKEAGTEPRPPVAILDLDQLNSCPTTAGK